MNAIATIPPSLHALALAGVDLPELDPPVVRVSPVREVVVVLPRSRRAETEVHLASCERDDVPVVTRPSGGGAVVLSPGVVAMSLLAPRKDTGVFPDPHFARFGNLVASALATCGVTGITQRGVSDLCLGERKVAGSALRLWRGRVLYQVSVLVNPDLALMDRYLPMPSRQPAYRRHRPHREFVTSLRDAGYRVAPELVAEVLYRTAAAVLLAGE
ncbi:MAG: hypothetical protein HRF46_00800 [Acidobacteriota bacterium]